MNLMTVDQEGYLSGPLDNGPARVLSLLVAMVVSALVTFTPQLVISNGQAPDHGILTLLLCGMAGAYIHGVGFRHRHGFWRVLLGPELAWLLLLVGGLMLFL